MNTPELVGTAYSYIRFSSRKQEQGDSVHRQTLLRDQWLQRHPKVTLDVALTMSDLGVSAFRGKHRTDDRTALSQFLRAVESGRVRPGSFLVVESLDRLSREELGDAFELVLGLVNRGIRIVQLTPVESILEKPVNMTGLMLAVVELSRANSESAMKSIRIGAKWAAKQTECRESGKMVTKASRAWLTARNGRFEFKPGAKALIRRVFRMATAGHGCRAIAKILNAENVKLWTGKPWYDQYVRNLLHGREVLGEYQQERGLPDGRREPAGEPILDYFPRAVTEAEWQAAQAALRSREKRGGRPTTQGDRVNVFQRLLYDARSGDRLHIFGKGKRLLLGPVGARHRGDSGTSFPLPAFERGILSALAELDPRELFDKDEGPDEVAELSARIARIDTQLRALVNMFDEDEVIPEVADKVRAKNAERAKLVELLDQARARAASPRSAAWGTCQGIIEELDKAGDQRELRVRLRQVLARIISVVHCMFGGSGMTRVAAAQVRFHDSEQVRNYLIVHRGSRWAKRPGEPPQTETLSFKAAGLRGELDLRDPKDAAALGRELSRWAKARV